MRASLSQINNKLLYPNHIFLKLFHNQTSRTSPLPYISPTQLNLIINTAADHKNIKHATQIHSQIITNNFTSISFIFNNLFNLYAKCGHFTKSITLFTNAQDESKDVITWTSVISQLTHSNYPYKALAFFKKMLGASVFPNQFTYSAVLPACADTRVIRYGEQVHCLICKHGFEFNLFVASALVDMYAKCGDMKLAEKLFDEMPERNLVFWNSVVVGFVQNKMYSKGVELFKEVLGVTYVIPNQVTFSSALSACANMGNLDIGRQVHGVVIKYGLIDLAYVRNSVMDMYVKCGLSRDSLRLFQTTGGRDVVTWNVIVMGSVQEGNFEEACRLFWTMRNEGISPDEASFSTVLHAAASIAALYLGSLVHNQVIKTGFGLNLCVVNSLIKMYAKCGKLNHAHRVFLESGDRNVVTWTTMISAFQQHGFADQAIKLFREMLKEQIPSCVTFVSILSACSHTGRVEEGFYYFNSMNDQYNLDPSHEHYACMVDLLSRAGRLDEAKSFVESMPIEPDVSVWGALLGGCNRHGNLEMGIEVAERLFGMEPDNSGNYVQLCNMYTRSGRFKEANEIRRLMGYKQVSKESGCSWIDFRGKTYVFTAHDRKHDMTNEIYEILMNLEKVVSKKGYLA